MAHTRKRFFSLMMSGIMTASLLPAYLTQLSIPAAADDPPSSDFEPDTSPTIDFDYGNDPNNPILNADDALKDIGKQHKHDKWYNSVQGVDAMKNNYSAYPWKHPDIIQEYNNGNEDDLRTMLESDEKEIEYIALSADLGDEWWKNGSEEEYAWNSIKITKDKVLDLNGHKLTLDYYGNKNHHKDAPEQEYTWLKAHYLTAFEISDGATLTIIDSSEWRGTSGTGRISFDAAEINHYDYNLRWYDHRDLFHVEDGNLIIYGGTYQAGDNKMLRVDVSNFTWSKFKSAIGSAVELAVNVAEYTTGISEAKAAYVDTLQAVNEVNTKVTAQAKSEPETQKNTPAEKNGGRNQSISEKALDSDRKRTVRVLPARRRRQTKRKLQRMTEIPSLQRQTATLSNRLSTAAASWAWSTAPSGLSIRLPVCSVQRASPELPIRSRARLFVSEAAVPLFLTAVIISATAARRISEMPLLR